MQIMKFEMKGKADHKVVLERKIQVSRMNYILTSTTIDEPVTSTDHSAMIDLFTQETVTIIAKEKYA